MAIKLPHNWSARPYQLPLLRALHSGKRRAVCVWHRRAGKDMTALNWTVPATQARIGTYYHLLPTYNQGRKILWDGMDRDGRSFLSYWPLELVRRKSEVEMQLELVNGSIWQIVGGDDPDRLVGTNPVGCVFSEFSLHNPLCWEYLRPILAENGGWAIFLFTPRGKNHAYDLLKMALKNEDEWFGEVLTVNDTNVISPGIIEAERRGGMSEEMIRQEFYCSFNAPQFGAYYGQEMMEARTQGRIRAFEPDKSLLTHTAWDLGFDDYMTIWWYQIAGQEAHILDYYENSGEGLAHYARVLDRKKAELDLLYGKHWAPHDIEVGEFSTGQTRRQTAAKLGIKFEVIPQTKSVADDIELVRQLIPRCYFRSPATDIGVSRLEAYRKIWDAKKEIFQERPLHDINSHGADGFRTLAASVKLTNMMPNITYKSAPSPQLRGVAGGFMAG